MENLPTFLISSHRRSHRLSNLIRRSRLNLLNYMDPLTPGVYCVGLNHCPSDGHFSPYL